MGELVAELKNHLAVLDGMLGPLCRGEILTLQSAERRMVRYLLAEMGGLCEALDGLEVTSGAMIADVSKTRTAM
jgi:hypothetical protein